MEAPEGSGKSPHGLNNRKLDKTIAYIYWKEILQYSDTQFTIPSGHCVAIINNIFKMHFLICRFGRVLAHKEAANLLYRSSPCEIGGRERGEGMRCPAQPCISQQCEAVASAIPVPWRKPVFCIFIRSLN